MARVNVTTRGFHVLLLAGLALAGPMIANKIPPNRGTGYAQRYPNPSKPNFLKGTGTYYYTTPASSYKTETPEYYTTRKQYSTTAQPYPIKESYSTSASYQQSTTPAPTYYLPDVAQSIPSHTRQPVYYSTATAAPMYYQEETYLTQPSHYYSPSTEAQSYYLASYVQETTEAPTYSRPVEPYKFNQPSYMEPSTYSIPTEATFYQPAASYTTTPPPMAYYEQATYSSEAPVYYTQGEESQYSAPPEGYAAIHEDYYHPQSTDYPPETRLPYATGETYHTDSQKYAGEEAEYYAASGYYTTLAPPAYYSTHAMEYYPATTPSYGKNPYEV